MRQLAAPMSLRKSYAYYYKLAEQQHCVLSSNADIEAFEYALKRFPSLSRVTISTRTHGRLFMPLYETPMIRAFPYGFVCPLPDCGGVKQKSNFLWQSDETQPQYDILWRGFCSALRVLARHQNHKIVEFIVEDHSFNTGVYFDLFQKDSHTYSDLISLVQRPGFSRLNLPLREKQHHEMASNPYHPAQKLSYLHGVLEQAKGLKSLTVSGGGIGFEEEVSNKAWVVPENGTAHYTHRPINFRFFLLTKRPLRQLRHLTLQGIHVNKKQLVTLLASLPNLSSLELRFISFSARRRHNQHCYSYDTCDPWELLLYMRKKLDWCQRPLATRPKVTMFYTSQAHVEGQTVKLESEVQDFLYGQGKDPGSSFDVADDSIYEETFSEGLGVSLPPPDKVTVALLTP
ncbi:hypothetical protein IL306_013539 [Fusarium sp. DS 682]|nr:hypothetical protein IL306_013539 [Fusarium sp. DS 682]